MDTLNIMQLILGFTIMGFMLPVFTSRQADISVHVVFGCSAFLISIGFFL